MKITKFVHSCVLVQDGSEAILFDPGIFSWQSGLIDISKLPELTAVVVTHQHGDHMAEPFVRAIAERFSSAQWFAPSDAHSKLAEWGVGHVTNQSTDKLEITEINHAPVEPFGVQVKNLIVHWNNKLTHPGDTHEISESKEILLLPVQAPWGTTVRALQLPTELVVKTVIPIHDWMWNDDWRANVYDRFKEVLGQDNIDFIVPKNGEPFKIA